MNPLSSRGRFEVDHLLAHTLWSYVRDSVAFEIPSGSITLAGDYDFTSAGNPIGLGINVHDLTVSDLALEPKGKDTHYIELKSIEVRGTQVDLAKRSVQVAKVHVAGGGMRAWRGADDSINLMELTAPHANAAPASTPSPAPGAPAAASQAAWTVSVPDISLDAFKISAEDRKVTPAFALTLDPISIHLAGFTTAPGANLEIDADTGINHNGKLTAKAQVSPDTGAVSAHTQLTGLDLTAFQPYITQQTSMTLLSGIMGTTLAVERDRNGVLSVTGDTNVTKLHTIDIDL
jgi:uncharacterized protein involved in outer membrane biogenesis